MLRASRLAALPVAALIVGLLIVGYRVVRLPVNRPAAFLRNAHQKQDKKVLVVVGDSLTHGTVSANYVDMLSLRLGEDYCVVNAGVNSEFAYNVVQRLEEIAACRPDIVTVLIGSNDANAWISPKFFKRSVRKLKLPRMPSPEWYEQNLRQIVETLQHSTDARIALLSLPPIGEDLDHPGVLETSTGSRIVRSVAARTEVAYLPLNERMTTFLKKNPAPGQLPYSSSRLLMYTAIIQRYTLGRGFDRISADNGFILHTDFLHLNTSAAGMIADLIVEFIHEPF